MTSKQFWKDKFKEEPKTDSEKLAIVMMLEYADLIAKEQHRNTRHDAIDILNNEFAYYGRNVEISPVLRLVITSIEREIMNLKQRKP